jgi:protein-S-isoprenylcysteine O-methyltransferase Ste14
MEKQLTKAQLLGLVFTRLIMGVPALLVLFFLPAGTWNYWEAWLYLAVLFIPMSFILIYLLFKAPELLERRMRMREQQTQQKRIIQVSLIYFLLAFALPGFDRRYSWSDVPLGVVIAADLLFLLGYGLFFLVLRENNYASRTVQVEQDQQVISSGPYRRIRHPMYLASILMYVFSPLALGSYWAVIPAVLIIPILVARIRNEESLLAKELKGYTDYMQRTPYRLLPGVW